MPNDAKLGLVLGVGVVLAVGVVFFRKGPLPATPVPAITAAPVGTVAAPRGQPRPAPAKTALRTLPLTTTLTTEIRHTVAAGETLADLARRYYGDAEQVEKIRQANPDVTADPLEPGTVLAVPDVPRQGE